MSMPVYRNRQGELIDLPSVSATRLKAEFGELFEQAMMNGPIAITRHGQKKAVLISYAEFEALTKARTSSLDALTREFNETLLTGMQTPAARKAMAAAFEASPARLGTAAAKAVTKRRR